MFPYHRGQFNAHADIDLIVRAGHAVALAPVQENPAASPADRKDHLVADDAVLLAAVSEEDLMGFLVDIRDGAQRFNLNALLQIVD